MTITQHRELPFLSKARTTVPSPRPLPPQVQPLSRTAAVSAKVPGSGEECLKGEAEL